MYLYLVDDYGQCKEQSYCYNARCMNYEHNCERPGNYPGLHPKLYKVEPGDFSILRRVKEIPADAVALTEKENELVWHGFLNGTLYIV